MVLAVPLLPPMISVGRLFKRLVFLGFLRPLAPRGLRRLFVDLVVSVPLLPAVGR